MVAEVRESLILEGMELIEYYRQNPVIAAYDLLRIKLAPVQRIVLRDLWFKNFSIFVAGRGCGKTFLLAVVAVLSCMLYPSYRVGLIGPVFRQAKNIFGEVERLYQRSSIFRDCTEKKPTRGSDTCYVRFKGTEAPGSHIEALPLGTDGSKIRGSRFFTICADEFAQIPESIFNTVIKPMAATTRDPMENVEKIQRQEELIRRGVLTADDIDDSSVNKIIMASSGFYKFNHMWTRMKAYWKMMEAGDEKYCVHQVPYWDMPKGFLDMDNIEEAKASMSIAEFQTEYEAKMVSDSDGLFKASLLEACSRSGHTITITGEPGKQYILGVDTAKKQDCFAVVVVEFGSPNRIVHVVEKEKMPFPEQAIFIHKLCNKFNVVRIFMDRFGGGESLKDILALGLEGHEPILDLNDKEHLPKQGNRILELCSPSTTWIQEANFGTKALLERKNYLFPEVPLTTISDQVAISYENVRKMKSQILNIVMTQNPSGTSLHFDTPTKGGRKDLYSAFILAGWGINKITAENEEEQKPILYQGGVITPRNTANMPVELVSPHTGRPFILPR